jgi:signal peptidase I
VGAAIDAWRELGTEYFSVVGSSMWPSLHDGDLVRVRQGGTDLRRGDIVVFRRRHALVAHRVVRIERRAGDVVLWARGDNSDRWDPPLGTGEVIGRVVGARRGDRYLALDTPAARSVGVVVAHVALAGEALTSRARSLKRRLLANRSLPFSRRLARVPGALGRAGLRFLSWILWRWKW